jgi:hypothetical protein
MRFLQLFLQLILLLTGYYGEGRKHFGGGKLEVGDERFERQLHCKCTRFMLAYVSKRQHTSAYVSIRQHKSAYASIRMHMSAYVCILQHTSAYVSMRQHTSAFVRIRPHPSACVEKR